MATLTSVQNGDWNVASTWDGGTIPTSSDTVNIDHVVTISAGAVANNIVINTGSLIETANYHTKITLTVNKIEINRLLNDDRTVRLDGITVIIKHPTITSIGIRQIDGLPTTYGVYSEDNTVIIDDPGVFGFSAQMQDIKPEGCARAYARKVSNGVRYMNVVVHIKNDRCDIMGQLYRMAENPFQVLAVTKSSLIKGFIEAITPVDSVGKEYRTFRVSIAEGL